MNLNKKRIHHYIETVSGPGDAVRRHRGAAERLDETLSSVLGLVLCVSERSSLAGFFVLWFDFFRPVP